MIRSAAVLAVILLSGAAGAFEPKEIEGKWELTEAVAGLPKGCIWDFQKGGKLQLTVGEAKIDFKWELKDKILHLEVQDKKDTTEVTKLTKTELVCRDKDGTTAKFKRVK